MTQEVKYIEIRELVLWTENPRDPIDEHSSDQSIVDRAIKEKSNKWKLASLANEMGAYYDLSEIPTVVYHNDIPVVYDGNRRIILAKIKLGFVSTDLLGKMNIPDVPLKIPCNVCSREVALKNVLRKHGDSGSWQPLERDIFLHRFMGEKKSPFLVLEEDTGIITAHPHLNRRFIKEEILNDEGLKKLGFVIENERLNSVYSNDDAIIVLNDISQKIKNKDITTRKNRGKVVEVLEPSSQQLVEQSKNKIPVPYLEKERESFESKEKHQRQSHRTSKIETDLFGGKLYLRMSKVSDIYRDIVDLYQYYIDNKNSLSSSFPGLVRMALRILCEAAAKEQNQNMERYVKDNFELAKQSLSQDAKTTLSVHNITKESIVQLLHTGAHNYQVSNNIEQTIAISIYIGALISISYRQGNQ